jgi:predicted PurR-regulated permease PerM
VDPASAPSDGFGPPAARVPTWLEHAAALGWRLLATAALAAVVLYIAGVLATITVSLIVVGIILAATAPLVARLRERGWSRGRSAAAGWGAAMAGIVVFAIVVLVAVIPAAVNTLQAIAAGLQAAQDKLADVPLSPEAVEALTRVAVAIKDWVSENVSELVGSISFIATVGVLVFFLTLFAMLDADRAVDWVLQAAHDDQRETLLRSGRVAVDRVGRFVRGSALIALTRAVATLAILWGLGVPDAPALAAIVFVGAFIPYVGVVLTTGAVVAAGMAAGGVTTALAVLGLVVLTYAAAEVLLRAFARARLTAVDPVTVLIAIPVGTAIAGVLGALVAVPVAIAVSVIAGAVVQALGSEAPGTEGSFVPPWLDRLGQWSWRLLVGIGVLAVGVTIVVSVPFIILPLVLAAVFAATLAPLVRRLLARGWGATASAFVATVGAVAVSVVILGLTVAALFTQVSEIVSSAVGGAGQVNEALGGLAAALASAAQAAGNTVTIAVSDAGRELVEVLVAVALSILLCFFFLRDGPRTWRTISGRLVAWRRDQADAAAAKAVNVLGGYMIATGAISAFGAATQWAIMFVLGLPLALPLAVLSFFGGFIPYIGSFITTGIALLVTIAVGTPTDIVVMLVFTVVFNIVQGNIVAPLVYGRAVNIHPAIVLMAIPAGGAIGGVMGMFLVVPVIGIVATTWRTVLRVFGDPPAGASAAMLVDDDGSGAGEAAVDPDAAGAPA